LKRAKTASDSEPLYSWVRGELGRALNLNALTVYKEKKQQKMLTKKFFEELGSLYTVRHGEVPADIRSIFQFMTKMNSLYWQICIPLGKVNQSGNLQLLSFFDTILRTHKSN
jgi:hypothetical protein